MSHEEFIQIVKTAIYEECTDGRGCPFDPDCPCCNCQ